jgi:hypothetical protein
MVRKNWNTLTQFRLYSDAADMLIHLNTWTTWEGK